MTPPADTDHNTVQQPTPVVTTTDGPTDATAKTGQRANGTVANTCGGCDGACLDPATLTDTHGEPVMFFRDHMWRGPEMPQSAITARSNR